MGGRPRRKSATASYLVDLLKAAHSASPPRRPVVRSPLDPEGFVRSQPRCLHTVINALSGAVGPSVGSAASATAALVGHSA